MFNALLLCADLNIYILKRTSMSPVCLLRSSLKRLIIYLWPTDAHCFYSSAENNKSERNTSGEETCYKVALMHPFLSNLRSCWSIFMSFLASYSFACLASYAKWWFCYKKTILKGKTAGFQIIGELVLLKHAWAHMIYSACVMLWSRRLKWQAYHWWDFCVGFFSLVIQDRNPVQMPGLHDSLLCFFCCFFIKQKKQQAHLSPKNKLIWMAGFSRGRV